jgi:glyoxalase family protein
MNLNGLHHVTAVTARAQENYNFYTQALGMRLVKKTVNQDDVSAYHLFYADKLGSPGADLTFFDWAVGPNRNGPGSIANTALRVPGREALDWWAERLTRQGLDPSGPVEFHGHDLINFTDPEGQHLSLVNDDGAPGLGKEPGSGRVRYSRAVRLDPGRPRARIDRAGVDPDHGL